MESHVCKPARGAVMCRMWHLQGAAPTVAARTGSQGPRPGRHVVGMGWGRGRGGVEMGQLGRREGQFSLSYRPIDAEVGVV